MTKWKNTDTGTSAPSGVNGPAVSSPGMAQASFAMTPQASTGQPQLPPPVKPRGIGRKILHGAGTLLVGLGETLVGIALSGLGVVNDE